MTLNDLIAFYIYQRSYRLEESERSELPQIRAFAAIARRERDILRGLVPFMHEPGRADRVGQIWLRWLNTILHTYQRNPRIYEHENTLLRQAARQVRDDELSQIRERVA